MRPLRLSMTAFGPYADTEVVDFEALAELGLFAVAGSNGSGKSTIFDGLHFALYGTLPGRRATYGRLRSDHAASGAECKVELDFIADGQRWRITRFPKQQRTKRRGTGRTETQQRASLARVVAGISTTVVNRIVEVNQRCRELVGLTGPQFERVALLPQGEFSRLLSDSSTARRDLLRALFSSEVFGDATGLLSEEAAVAAQTETITTTQLDRRLATVTERLCELHDISSLGGEATAGSSLAEYRSMTLTPLQRRVTTARRHATNHTTALQRAIDLSDRFAARDALLQSISAHEAQRTQVEADVRRLDAARAAVPVVDISHVARNQRIALDKISHAIAEIHHDVAPLLVRIDEELGAPTDMESLGSVVVAVDHVERRLAEQIKASEQIDALDRTVAALAGEADRLAQTEETTTAQHALAVEQRSRAELERDDLESSSDIDGARAAVERCDSILGRRSELQRLDDCHRSAQREFASLENERVRLDTEIDDGERAERQQAQLNQAAQTSADELVESERRCRVHHEFAVAHDRLDDVRRQRDSARLTAERSFDGFIRGASARLAETLSDGEPCSVCGSIEHPRPAETSAEVVTEIELAHARRISDQLAQRCSELELELEAIRRIDPDVAGLDPASLAEAVDSAVARALAAEHAAADNIGRVADLGDRRERRGRVDVEIASSAEQIAVVDEQRNQLIGALGDDARETVERLQRRADHAVAELARAESAADRLRLVAVELIEVDGRIDTIDLALVDLQRNRVATGAELAARRRDLAATRSVLPNSSVEDPGALLATARRAATLLTDLRGAFAEHAAAGDSSRRAELTLAEKLTPSPFTTTEEASAAFLDTDIVTALEASTAAWTTTGDRLHGERRALGDLPDIAPDIDALRDTATSASLEAQHLEQELMTQTGLVDRLQTEIDDLEAERAALDDGALATRRLERTAALVKGDNPQNTSLENWVLAAHLRDVIELANVRLARSTQQRFQLCVLDEGESRRGLWGLEIAVEDTVTGTRRPTAGLSGGELFQASLALALGLADVVMNQSAGVAIDALFIDEGFGSLDDSSVERVIDLLDDVRSRGATVGVITHVSALLDVLPRGITVKARPDGHGSTIEQPARAA